MNTAALEIHSPSSFSTCRTPEERVTNPLLPALPVFGVRGRTGVLSGLFLPLCLGSRLVPSKFWMGERKDGRNRDLLATS